MDDIKNFARSTLASGITSGATTLSVASGEGVRFPAVPFNAVIWDGSVLPSADPNAEIVRVTGISTDTFTITRGQEGTSGVAHNTGGKTYAISAAPTVGLFRQFLPLTSYVAADAVNGTTTYVDVMSVTVEARAYRLQIELLFLVVAANNLRFRFAGGATPDGSTSSAIVVWSVPPGPSFIVPDNSGTHFFEGGSDGVQLIIISGTVVFTAAGTFKIQMKDVATDGPGDEPRVVAGSGMTLIPV